MYAPIRSLRFEEISNFFESFCFSSLFGIETNWDYYMRFIVFKEISRLVRL